MRRSFGLPSARWAASVALVGAIVVGCAPQQQAPGTTTGGTQPGTTQQQAPQELRYPLESLRTLDPGLATDNVSIDVITKIFDGLVDQAEDGQIKPMLAEKWEVSSDATKFTFTLRSNAKWSDGKNVTADDFVYAMQRVLDPKTGAEYAKTISMIKGGEKALKGEAPPSSIGVRAVSPTVLEITMEEPAAYFLSVASTWTAMPVRKDILDKFGDKWISQGNIVTTGAFKLTEWVADQRIVLTRNEEYWGPKPPLSKITMRIFPDGPDQEGQILRAYEAGELDTTGKRDVPPSEVDRVLRDATLSKEVMLFDQSRSTWVCVNNIKAPFSDVRVRRALGISLERDRLINQVLKSPFKFGDDIVPPGIAGRNPSAWPKENLAEAKQLLAQAGYPDGRGFPEFTYLYNTSALNKAIAEYLQSRWKEGLGLNVKLEAMDFPVLIPLRRGNKTYDSFRCSWGSDFEDPVNWYNTLFESSADQTQQTTNWKNTQFDTLVKQAAGNTNAAQRKQQYEQAAKLMGDDYFAIPLFFGAQRVLVKPYVKNYVVSRIAYGARLRDVSIQK
jgi:oligopeptide transport system substrate-binding protein